MGATARVPAELHKLPQAQLVAARALLEVLVRHLERVPLHHQRQRQHAQRREDGLHRLRVREPVRAVDDVDAGAQTEDTHLCRERE